MQLPAIRYPENALIDFKPINNALMQYRQAGDNQVMFAADQAERERRARIQERQLAESSAARAEDMKMRRAEFGQRQQMMPLELEAKRLGIQAAQRSLDPMAEFNARKGIAAQIGLTPDNPNYQTYIATGQMRKDDPFAPMINRLMQGDQQPAPQQGQPRLQLQSGEGNVMPGGVTPAQSSGAAPVAPQQTPEMVRTPMGMMPKDQAQRMGLALGLAGKGEAGKIFMESSKENALDDKARNTVDANELAALDGLSRLKEISRTYDEKFLTLENQLKQWRVGWTDRIEGLRGKLPPEVMQEYEASVAFKRNAYDNVNRYIKEMTGAAMTNAEAERILKGIPNADGDSPRAFSTKLRETSRALQLVIARSRYLRRNGFAGDVNAAERSMPLDRMKSIINKRASDLLKDAATRNIPEEQALPLVRRQLRAEFGVDA